MARLYGIAHSGRNRALMRLLDNAGCGVFVGGVVSTGGMVESIK